MFFTNSGTEANELALMMAKLYTGCQDIVSIRNGYHGNAAGTMGATAQSMWKFNVVQVLYRELRFKLKSRISSDLCSGNFVFVVVCCWKTGVHHAVNPDPYRGVFGSDGEKYARDVQEIIQYGTTGHIAGFVCEAIQVSNQRFGVMLIVMRSLKVNAQITGNVNRELEGSWS